MIITKKGEIMFKTASPEQIEEANKAAKKWAKNSPVYHTDETFAVIAVTEFLLNQRGFTVMIQDK